jgi:RHS repeat-associated protein
VRRLEFKFFSSGLSLSYNSLNQTTSMNGVSMEYADVTQDERTSSGSTDFSYTRLGLSSRDSSTDTYFTRDNQGRLIGMRQGSDRFYYHLDHVGSVIALTDQNGNQVGQRYEYEPYGKQIAGQTQVDNPWRFASGFHDASTGFLKFGTRYYDPNTMRWTQPDPEMGRLDNPISLNRYQYAACNPVNFTDSSGRELDLVCVVNDLFNPFGGAFQALLGAGVDIAIAGAAVFQYASQYGVSTLLAVAGGAPLILIGGGVVAYAIVLAVQECS